MGCCVSAQLDQLSWPFNVALLDSAAIAGGQALALLRGGQMWYTLCTSNLDWPQSSCTPHATWHRPQG